MARALELESSLDGSPDLAERLERDGLIALPGAPFRLSNEEGSLLACDLSDGRAKTISLGPKDSGVRGAKADDPSTLSRLAAMMRRYADWAEALVGELAPRYAASLTRGRTSYRPRSADAVPRSARKDDRRLHVDAFPSEPTGGRRILRVFSNINPAGEARIWWVGERFEDFARRWIDDIPPLRPGEAWLLHKLGVTRGRRTAYDALMLGLHDRAKLSAPYQMSGPRRVTVFPAGASWIVFSDSVVHAAIGGRHALEQTFYLPLGALVDESRSPLRILERMTGRILA